MKITQICILCAAFVCLVGCAEVIDDIIASNPDILLPDDGIIEDAHIQSVEIRDCGEFSGSGVRGGYLDFTGRLHRSA